MKKALFFFLLPLLLVISSCSQTPPSTESGTDETPLGRPGQLNIGTDWDDEKKDLGNGYRLIALSKKDDGALVATLLYPLVHGDLRLVITRPSPPELSDTGLSELCGFLVSSVSLNGTELFLNDDGYFHLPDNLGLTWERPATSAEKDDIGKLCEGMTAAEVEVIFGTVYESATSEGIYVKELQYRLSDGGLLSVEFFNDIDISANVHTLTERVCKVTLDDTPLTTDENGYFLLPEE